MRFLALLLFFLSIQINAENIKIGYIDIDKVIENSSLYMVANSKLTEEFQPRKDELLVLYNNIIDLKAKLKLPNDIKDDFDYHKDIKEIQTLNENLKKIVPNVAGLSETEAVQILKKIGLKVKVKGSGSVKLQSLKPGTLVQKKRNIILELS